MPHLTVPCSDHQCLLRFNVGVTRPRANALKEARLEIPDPRPATALIDSGASISVLDITLIRALQLTLTGSVRIHTPTTGSQSVNRLVYDISIHLHHQDSSYVVERAVPVAAGLLRQSQEIDLLLGTDILRHCLFLLDGPADTFLLGF